MRSYKDIRAILLERITSGAWPPGERIPDEVDLAREFGCTRPTVSRAMRGLVEAGLVERRRKAGTRVVRRDAREAVVAIPVVRAEIERRGSRYRFLCLRRRLAAPPAPIRAALGLDPRRRALHVLGLHLADERPWQLEDRWINLQTVPAARHERFDDVSPNEWLLARIPYSRAEHAFSAGTPGEEERELLALAPDEPVFVIERTTWLGADAVTRARLSHPGHAFRLTSRDPLALPA